MLKLPDVTALSIDTHKPHRTIEALDFSSRWVQFADIVLLTDTRKHPNLQMPKFGVPCCERPFRVVHHEQSDRKVECPNKAHYKLPIDYEYASMREPASHFTTSHCLFLEWDSAILNPLAWRDEWLEWDMVASPWFPHLEPGWEACTWDCCVGNFGASLRSKKFCEATRAALEHFKDDPRTISCDMFCCRTARPWMEENFGVKFAPPEVAMAFGCENRVYAQNFLYHGVWTVELNGWGGNFFNSRKPRPRE